VVVDGLDVMLVEVVPGTDPVVESVGVPVSSSPDPIVGPQPPAPTPAHTVATTIHRTRTKTRKQR
jgi:hypothetical protein